MKAKIYLMGLVALCGAAFLPVTPAHGQTDGALLDALVKKGVLSDQEREDIIADEQKDYSQTAASKINIASSIKSITFYGDLRLRYEYREGGVRAGDLTSTNAVYKTNENQVRSRWRYRLRFGFKGDLYDNFFYGVRLATGYQNDRSGNVTFGDGDNGGVYGNTKSLIGVDRAFIGWKPTDYLTLIGGKMENPLYTTGMVWSGDLSPTGAAEVFDKKIGSDLEVFATAGQWVYADSGTDNNFSLGGVQSYSDVFMFAEQVGFKVNFDENTFFKMGATMYTYSGAANGSSTTVAGLYSGSPLGYAAPNNSPSLYNGPFVGISSAPGSNVSGINNLAVVEVPMEFDFKIGKLPMRVFSDFAYNFQADQRADQARTAVSTMEATGVSNVGVTAPPAGTMAAFNASTPVQGLMGSGKSFLDQAAYQIGVEAGQQKKKGDWDGQVFWQSTGYYAIDPNLNDADIFNAATNLEGVVVAVSHCWTDALTSTVRYAHATPVNDKLATPNFNQDLQVSTIHDYNLFQADLMWKF